MKKRNRTLCLNCETRLSSHFCPNCGQENIEHRDSFVHLVLHYFQDLFHYDSKFLNTIRYLFTKPGWLSLEFMKGKRASYLEPIKLYVFTSSVFFLLFFSTVERDFNISKKIKQDVDSTGKNASIGKLQLVNENELDNWFDRRLFQQQTKINEAAEKDFAGLISKLFSKFIHYLPVLSFVTLPFTAFFCFIFFYRKEYYFVDHFVLSIHNQVATFCISFLLLFLIEFQRFSNVELPAILFFLIMISSFLYVIFAYRRFYSFSYFSLMFRYTLQTIFTTILNVFIFILSLLFLAVTF